MAFLSNLFGGSWGGGQSASNNTSSQTNSYIPEWLGATGQGAVERADALSYRPYDPYTGQTVAPPSGDTLAAYQGVHDLQGQGDPALTASYNAYNNLVGQAKPQTTDQLTAATNPLYFNFEQNVLDPSWKAYGNALGQTQAGFGNAQGQSQGYYGNAIGQNQGLLGNYLAANSPATAEQVGRNATALMSPYRDDVINPALAAGQQQLALAKQGVAGNANQAGAFGGSRQGVQEGVADAQTSLGTQQFIGNMLNQGWGQALTPAYGLASQASQQGYNAANTLAGQNFNAADRLAQQAYGAAAQTGAQGATMAANLGQMMGLGYGNAATAGQNMSDTNLRAGIDAAGALPNVAQSQQNMDLKDITALQASGKSQENYQQQLDNSGMAGWVAQQNWPVQNLDMLLSAVGAIPYSTSGTAQGYGNMTQRTDPGMLNSITGLAGVAGSIIGGAGAAGLLAV